MLVWFGWIGLGWVGLGWVGFGFVWFGLGGSGLSLFLLNVFHLFQPEFIKFMFWRLPYVLSYLPYFRLGNAD